MHENAEHRSQQVLHGGEEHLEADFFVWTAVALCTGRIIPTLKKGSRFIAIFHSINTYGHIHVQVAFP